MTRVKIKHGICFCYGGWNKTRVCEHCDARVKCDETADWIQENFVEREVVQRHCNKYVARIKDLEIGNKRRQKGLTEMIAENKRLRKGVEELGEKVYDRIRADNYDIGAMTNDIGDMFRALLGKK